MNAIAWIILLALILDFLLSLAADVLNLGHLKTQPPDEFKDRYDPERYRRSQAYLRDNTRFGWVTAAVHLTMVLAFWFGGGFPWVDTQVRSLGWGTIASGVLYVGGLVLLHSIVSLPFQFYATFVIEERYGFNRTTLTTFVIDRLKGAALGLLLGGPLLAGVLYFFEFSGANAWWYSWLAVIVFMLVMQYIAPTWLMPLFNRFEPLKEESLKQAIMDYAASIRFPLRNVFIMDGSRRSARGNAFFTGFGRNKRIVLFDTLVRQHSTEELVAVLGHEMGHYKQHHILGGLIISILQTGLMFFLLSLCITHPALFEAFKMPHSSVYAGLVFFGLLYAPIDFFSGLLSMLVSRRNEFSADRFAVRTTGDGAALINALKTLTVNHLSNLSPHPFYVFLNYSHPPVMQRIQTIRALSLKGG
ncbi:MAG: M48 family metallopeptidase [Desulfosarcina sp.]|nr:M48 family metallopeptidase [Desulfobacterales bacterium]